MNLANENKSSNNKSSKISIEETKANILISNMSLKPSVLNSKIEQCKKIIKESGIYPLPIAGKMPDSKMIIVHGQDEIDALKEMGETSVSTVVVGIKNEQELNRLTLQLIQLRKTNTSLSEAILAEKMLSSGKYTLQDIATAANKSKSLICKMIKMIKRMSSELIKMVSEGKLSVHMAINISKLPLEAQFEFAVKSTNSLIAQRDIEKIITTVVSDETPEEIKKIIISEPSAGIKYIKQSEKSKYSRTKCYGKKGAERAYKENDCSDKKNTENTCNDWFEIRFMRVLVVELENRIALEIANIGIADKKPLKELGAGISRLHRLIEECVNNNVAHRQ